MCVCMEFLELIWQTSRFGVWMYFNYLIIYLQLSMFKDLEEGGLGMGIQRLQVNSSPLEYESAAGARK